VAERSFEHGEVRRLVVDVENEGVSLWPWARHRLPMLADCRGRSR
jgi:hypothetical protein